MEEYLSGKLSDRLRELRESRKLSKADVAKAIGINRSTYGRIEEEVTESVDSKYLIELARFYDVTTDFLLGINNTPEKTYYAIGQLGLSVEAAESLAFKRVDVRVINELLINRKFAAVTQLIAAYLSDSAALLARTGNAMVDMYNRLIVEQQMDARLPRDEYISNVKRNLKASKDNPNTRDIQKINEQFAIVLKEIKAKVLDEVAEYLDSTKTIDMQDVEKLCSKAIEDMKENRLTKEEMTLRVSDLMKCIVSESESIQAGDIGTVNEAIDLLAPVLSRVGEDPNG